MTKSPASLHDFMNSGLVSCLKLGVCEWNKHMDRHELPYKCSQCQFHPLFTYLGVCSRANATCTRCTPMKHHHFAYFTSAVGVLEISFTRKENFEELRRCRHFWGVLRMRLRIVSHLILPLYIMLEYWKAHIQVDPCKVAVFQDEKPVQAYVSFLRLA